VIILDRFGSKDSWSETYHFLSPWGHEDNVPFNFIAFGDSGTSYCEEMQGVCGIVCCSLMMMIELLDPPSSLTTTNVANDVDSEGYDLIIHVGDLSCKLYISP
jgi:hypothetical protein